MIKPLRSDVLFRKIESKLSTDFGLILRDPIEVDRAIVIAVGPLVTQISPNDIFIADWTKIKYNDNDLYIISENDIAIVLGDC